MRLAAAAMAVAYAAMAPAAPGPREKAVEAALGVAVWQQGVRLEQGRALMWVMSQ